MRHVKKYLLFLTLVMPLLASAVSAEEERPRPKVYVIAYQFTSFFELKDLAIKNNWLIVPLDKADTADTVVAALRIDQVDFLKSTYSDYRELEEDVRKNNRKGGKLHIIYFYKVEKDKTLTLEKYNRYNPEY